MKPGDEVQVRANAAHVFDSFRGATAAVLDVRTLGDREWCHLDFEELGRETWLPCSRLEPVKEEASA